MLVLCILPTLILAVESSKFYIVETEDEMWLLPKNDPGLLKEQELVQPYPYTTPSINTGLARTVPKDLSSHTTFRPSEPEPQQERKSFIQMEFPRSRISSNQFEQGWDYDDEEGDKDSKDDSKNVDEKEQDGKALSIGKERAIIKLDSRKGKAKEWHGKIMSIRTKLIPRG